MANLENLKRLRDHMASLPDEAVDMAVYVMERGVSPVLALSHLREDGGYSCGTVACIAGYACAIMPALNENDSFYDYDDELKIEEIAQEWLDLTESEARTLFSGLYNSGECPHELAISVTG